MVDSIWLAIATFSLVFDPAQAKPLASNITISECRCFPGDACWPKPSEWYAFNKSVGGKLIATTPIASPCHDDAFGPFDAQQCDKLKANWFIPETHLETTSSIMAPYFTNNSCSPFLDRNARCTLGNYISYAVNASEAADFQRTIGFVQENNIRLTVRNTGHDYNGKATGAGAVGIWTHHMKAMEIFDYYKPNSSAYIGKAVKIGAGVQADEVYRYTQDAGFVVVGSNNPSVGIAGGYTQGGGHGPLASKFGMAADQALEWEVVTATGEHLIAIPSQHANLYWALSGGGGGTYGVVVSLTVKAHHDLRTSVANLTFSSLGVDQDSFWSVVQTFQESLPTMVDTGCYVSFFLTNESFAVVPIQGPGVPRTQLRHLLNATLTKLEAENIQYTFNIDEFSTFYQSFKMYNPPTNVSQLQIGGRLIPRSLVENNISALVRAERRIIDSGVGAILSGVCVNVSIANPAINSVNPYWRTAIFDATIGTPYSYTNDSSNFAYAKLMTDHFLPMLEDLTPSGGAYLSEGDFQQPGFQKVFYGGNYASLKAIKRRYDPLDTFYAITAVGSENWYEDHAHGGRLCPVTG